MGGRKVLLCGSVDGKFEQLCKRVASVNKANGPFDMLLCIGVLFSKEDEGRAGFLTELKNVIASETVPIPIYFVCGDQVSASQLQEAIDSSEKNSPIQVLQSPGLDEISDLSVAHISSKNSEEDIKNFGQELDKASGDIDFLLSDEWPERATAICPPGTVPEGTQNLGTRRVAEMALKVRPRYLIAAGDHFFARLPYLNKDLGAGSHVTRFISLAEVGNTRKQKCLHALGLQPASEMDPETLQQKPTGTTPCPFAISKKRPAEQEPNGGQSWRWEEKKKSKQVSGGPDMVQDDRRTIYVGNLPYNAEDEDIAAFLQLCGEVEDVKRGFSNGKPNTYAFVQFKSIEGAHRACEMSNTNFMGRDLRIDTVRHKENTVASGDPVQGCWFCLSSEKADVNLIVSIGEEMYLAMDKGPINPHHVLILPIEHRANTLDLSSAAYGELERYFSALRTCFASQGRELLAFERYMVFKNKGGNHLQFNVLSIPKKDIEEVKRAYLAVAKQHNLKFKPVEGPSKGDEARGVLRDAVGDGEYFLVIFPDGSRMVHTVRQGQKHHLPFGREAAANLAGVPARADWKTCQGDAKQEEEITGKFKDLFKSYDIMSG